MKRTHGRRMVQGSQRQQVVARARVVELTPLEKAARDVANTLRAFMDWLLG